jgi:hypothetical protein
MNWLGFFSADHQPRVALPLADINELDPGVPNPPQELERSTEDWKSLDAKTKRSAFPPYLIS